MRNTQRLFIGIIFVVVAIVGNVAQAAVTTFSTRAAWQAAAGTATTIDFSTKDDGTPISSPAADVIFSTLTLKGATFLNVHSYVNQYLYTPDSIVLRVNLPANTTALGVDLSPIFDTSGTYTIRLSSGEQFTAAAGVISLSFDFFGVTSTTPIQWVEVSLNTTYLKMDNFSFVAPPSVLPVGIDILPGIPENKVEPGDNGYIPVAILSSATFLAATVDVPSVRFGATGTEAVSRGSTLFDVNRDGKPDLILFFRTRDTGIVCTTTAGILTGQTTTGQKIKGTDVIQTDCKKPGGKKDDKEGEDVLKSPF